MRSWVGPIKMAATAGNSRV